MGTTTYEEDNRALLAWGAQRLVPDLGASADGKREGGQSRQLSDFYGVDEPSLNSFIFAGQGDAAAAHNAHAAPLERVIPHAGRNSKRCVSHYERGQLRAQSTRRQPATMPATAFPEMNDAPTTDGDREKIRPPSPPLQQPKVSRSDSLLNKARRVLSMPTGGRRHPFGRLTNNGSPPTPSSTPDSQLSAPAAVPVQTRSHLSHHSRKNHTLHQKESNVPPAAVPSAVSQGTTASDPATKTRIAEMEARIKDLEGELDAQRKKCERQRKRILELEEENILKEQAIPALGSIVRTTMTHFEAKELALKRTIAELDQNYTNALSEKNEAVRMFAAFVGPRGHRSSPPDSVSTVSESGTEGGSNSLQTARRVQSLDTHRRSVSRSLFTNVDFENNR